MKRLLLVFALACPVCVAGVVAVGLASWALVGLGLLGIVTPVLVVGLAATLPLSIVAADRLVPGAADPARGALACPNCGLGLAVGAASKPAPPWDV